MGNDLEGAVERVRAEVASREKFGTDRPIMISIDHARLILAALSAQDGWKDIASAPKDGTVIDVWIKSEFFGRRTDVSWREPSDSEWWVHGGDTIETAEPTWHDCFGPLGRTEPPTHWRPLPTPPIVDEGRGA